MPFNRDHISAQPLTETDPIQGTRVFATGATRDQDDSKLDYEGFFSPLVMERYAQYMRACQLRNPPPGEKLRASDNWQKGIPFTVYMKSMFRHFVEAWTIHRGWSPRCCLETALCALMFNVHGYLHELLKGARSR